MSTTVVLYLITYLAMAAFVLAVAARFVKIFRMPLHLRWELYPVAHEMGNKAKYGGSKLEEVDWWTKEEGKSRINELKAMIPEMTFLVLLYEQNRKLWYRSFPFHFGLYILSGMLALLGLGAVCELYGVTIAAAGTSVGSVIYYLTKLAAIAGLFLASFGAVGLLQMRLGDANLRGYTSPATIFNLLFFLLVFIVAWLTLLFADPTFDLTRAYVQNLLTFNLSAPVGSALLGLEILLAVVLIAYIPMTHMAHFFLKWFTWHKIRWDDEPNRIGGAIEQKIIEQVQYPVSWSAPHINADGKKNWLDIATEEIEKK
ncbi:MAG: nitrate reductase [Candidatus Omnitrophota bacterium]|nr:MAG: nitrate reductase [Candidatus Omnitrophota bacterium]